VALIASFYLRKWIGRRTWRLFHYVTYLAFTLALVHGLMAGTDSRLPAMQILYYGTGLSIIFFTSYRVLTIKTDARRNTSSQPGSVNRRRDATQLATAPLQNDTTQRRYPVAAARGQTGKAQEDSVL
jgi:DMSO/TMAO reductase YedYZ heme-binding membrane subunit